MHPPYYISSLFFDGQRLPYKLDYMINTPLHYIADVASGSKRILCLRQNFYSSHQLPSIREYPLWKIIPKLYRGMIQLSWPSLSIHELAQLSKPGTT